MLFVTSKKLPLIKSTLADGLTYQPGVLNVIAFVDAQGLARDETSEYWQTRWGKYDFEKSQFEKQDKKSKLELSVALDARLFEKVPAILAADVTQELTPAQVVGWYSSDSEFFEACYQAAIEANPGLKPEYKADQPQPETKDESGNALGEDEVKKKASSRQRKQSNG